MSESDPWARPGLPPTGSPDAAPLPGAPEATASATSDTPLPAEPVALASEPPLPPVMAETPPGSGAPPPRGGPSNTILLALIGVMLVLLVGLAGGLAWYLLRDDSDSTTPAASSDPSKPTATIPIPPALKYDTTLADSDYDLESMQLRNADMPEDVVRQSQNNLYAFDNAEWAQILNPDDPELKENQLDAQKRVRNLVSFYGWGDISTARIGQALSFLSQSTLYASEDAAIADEKKLCGLRIDDTDPLKSFSVPKLGDDSVGFTVTSPNDNFGHTVDTVICFRTGRIVNGVVQTAFLGAENQGLTLELAKKMLQHVNETFQGKPIPKDDEPPLDTGTGGLDNTGATGDSGDTGG